MDFLDFRLLGPLKWREPQKSPKFVDFVKFAPFPEAISKAPVDFLLDLRLLGPLKWREPYKSPKVVDFVSGSHFQGPCGFPAFPASGTAEMEGTPQKPKSCRFCRVRSFSGSHFQGICGFAGFPADSVEIEETGKTLSFLLFWQYFCKIPSGKTQQMPRICPGRPTKSSEFDNCHEDCGLHVQTPRIFRGFRQHESLSKRTNRLKSAPRTPETSVQGLGYLP